MRSKIILFILCSLGKLEAYGLIKQVQELSASWSGMEGEAFLGRGGGSAGRDHDHDAWNMGFCQPWTWRCCGRFKYRSGILVK